MISAIGGFSSQHVAETASPAQSSSLSQVSSKAPAGSSSTSVPADKVTLSSAAQSMMKELTETPAQTQREASSGDLQARRLLAKEAAAHGQ